MKYLSENICRRTDSPCAVPASGSRPYRRPRRVAVGLKRKDRSDMGVRTLTIQFDDDTFTEVRSRAVRERTSFAEQVRRFVEWGLESCP